MKYKQGVWLDDLSEIGRMILAEINLPGLKKHEVLKDLLTLGVLAKRAGMHALAGRIVYIPEAGCETLLFVSDESKDAAGKKVWETKSVSMLPPRLTNASSTPEVDNKIAQLENFASKNEITKIGTGTLSNLKKLATGSSAN